MFQKRVRVGTSLFFATRKTGSAHLVSRDSPPSGSGLGLGLGLVLGLGLDMFFDTLGLGLVLGLNVLLIRVGRAQEPLLGPAGLRVGFRCTVHVAIRTLGLSLWAQA